MGGEEITANGKALNRDAFVYYMMNKPAGVLCATRDPSFRTVLDLVPESTRRKGLFPAGRLDKDTEGFVLLTNDGALAHRVLSPKNHVPKTYFARVDAPVPPELKRAFAAGVTLGNGDVCKPAALEPLGGNEARVIITEGMYHQIKRMFHRHGLSVVYLRREKIGGLALDAKLPLGGVREITPEELGMLCGERF
jgi:16S rRNA pseudouridine516 synthase